MKRKRIVVMGFMASQPIAGVIWQHIHYIVGLQRLGHDVYYIEDSARYSYNPATSEVGGDFSYAVDTLQKLGSEFGFEGRWAYCARYAREPVAIGLGRKRIAELYREADAIFNICGVQELNEDLAASDRLIYVESDPGVEQIKIDSGRSEVSQYLGKHHTLFTFGENVGSESFPVPLHRIRWLPTRQPVVTDFWKSDFLPPPDAVLTTITNWNTSGRKDIEWRGDTYLWSKSLEFLKFVEAPVRSGEPFELATGIRDLEIAARFKGNGWRLVDPHPMSVNLNRYRAYLQESKGEFTAAKDQYVRLHTGWFSDRSACYLAAGRPVITQETGFSDHLGIGNGLFAFETLPEISETVRVINADYPAQCRGAWEVACEYFEATKVLASLLDRAAI